MQTYLRDAKELGGVAQAPVAELMGENSHNLLSLALLNQGVIDDNMLLPRETKEVGIAMGAALAAVNHIQLMQRELELLGQGLDVGLELAFLQGRQLVEEGQNGNGVDGNHEDLETSGEQPEIVEELVARLLDDGKETGENGRGKNEGDEVGLDHIRDKDLGRLLVEAELLFQNERVVDASWE